MQKIDESQGLNPAVPLETSEVDLLARVLSDAFYDEPSFVYLMPDEKTRRIVSPLVFRHAIRASQMYGDVHTTQAVDGAALWLSPARDWTLTRMVRTGMVTMPFKLEWSAFRRFIKLAASIDKVRKQLAAGSHWYLMALGVKLSKEREDIRGTLIQPVLSRADSTGFPCYLETFDETSLAFYARHGFRITGAGHIPGGPNFWAMTRPPGRR
jgi:hypothetical protein